MPYAGFRLACRSPLCSYAAWSPFAVSELQLSAETPLWLYHRAASNRIQLSAICRGGQSGKVIALLARRCLPLDHPSAASGAFAVEQISSSKRQCGERQASLKAAKLMRQDERKNNKQNDIVVGYLRVFPFFIFSCYILFNRSGLLNS